MKNEFKKYLEDKEIYKFIKDTIQENQNVLLIIDGDKSELPEIIETYTDTWGKMLRLIQIKKFVNNGESIYTMHPDFENIEYAEIEDAAIETEDIQYDEEYHLTGVSDTIRQLYNDIKNDVLKANPSLIFNPQKYYISIRNDRNIAFFMIRRKKIRLVVMQSDVETRKELTKHTIKTLTPGIQRFWNGPSCAIILDNNENLEEVKRLIKKLAAKV